MLILKHKDVTPEGHIVDMTVWSVPKCVPPSKHVFKYSLVYIVEGKRIVGFDNERGTGDHCHLDGNERSYAFSEIDKLINDFIKEVEMRRK